MDKSIVDIEARNRLEEGHLRRSGCQMTWGEYDAFAALCGMCGMEDSLGRALAFFTYDETMERLDAFCERRRSGGRAVLRVYSLHQQVARIATFDAAEVYRAVNIVMRERNLDHCVFTLGDPACDLKLGFFVVALAGQNTLTVMGEDCPKAANWCEAAE